MQFIMENLATILVGLGVVAIVTLVIISMRAAKKKNPDTGGCGCGCNSCPYARDCDASHKEP